MTNTSIVLFEIKPLNIMIKDSVQTLYNGNYDKSINRVLIVFNF